MCNTNIKSTEMFDEKQNIHHGERMNKKKITKSKIRDLLDAAHCAKVQKYKQGKIGVQFLISNNVVGHYGKIIKILNGCPDRSALKGTPMKDLIFFSIMFYSIFSTTYQRIGDLFCHVIFLHFRTVRQINLEAFHYNLVFLFKSLFQKILNLHKKNKKH